MLFDIVNGEVVLSPEALAIPPFRKLWESHKDKKLAQRKIEYIVFMYKWDTVYKGLSPDKREEKLKIHCFDDAKYKIDNEMKEVIDEYVELQNTISTRLLLAEEEGIEYIIRQFNSIKYLEGKEDKSGKPLIDPDKVGKWMDKANKAIDVRNKLLKTVRTEQMESSKVKGGTDIGLYELPKR